MSVIVRDMKMPESCAMCPLCHRNFDGNETRLACYATKKWAYEDDERPKWCPLFEVKDWRDT